MNFFEWYSIPKSVYTAGKEEAKLNNNALYFINDTHEIFKGSECFNEPVKFYTDTKPETPAVGVIYINTTNLEGSVYNGSTWKVVIQAIQSTVDSGNTTAPVTGKAIADYVAERIAEATGGATAVKDVTYSKDNAELTVTKGDENTSKIVLDGLGTTLEYVAGTGELKLKDKSGNQLGSSVNLALERFVSEASYDPETHMITLQFNDDGEPIEIDVGDLVDTYTGGTTATTTAKVTAGNEIQVNVKVSGNVGNQLTTDDQGLYVAPTDISGKIDKVAGEHKDELLVATANGSAALSGKKVGGATLTNNDVNTLATEAAVEAIRSALQTNIDAKMAKVSTGKDNEILVATADGSASASGKKFGGATLNEVPNENTLATEAAVSAITGTLIAKTSIVASGAIAEDTNSASDEKVISEKALVDALTWKTSIK